MATTDLDIIVARVPGRADTSLLQLNRREGLAVFERLLGAVGVEGAKHYTEIAAQEIRALGGGDQAPAEVARLEQGWYTSLASGTPDYGVYGGRGYLAEAWACWWVYSRKYLRSLQGLDQLYPAIAQRGMIVDLGCGLGITTAALKQLYPAAQVIGTQLRDSLQWAIASRLAQDFRFAMVEDIQQARDRVYRLGVSAAAGLVVASEYFEHFQEPLRHLDEVLDTLDPDQLLIANTFTQPSLGHFPRYRIGDQEYDGAHTSRAFNNQLRSRGYAKVKTGFWNGRPAFWIRLDKSLMLP